MGLLNNLTESFKVLVGLKHPTLKGDAASYADGANKTFDSVYNEYIQSVETIDRVIRVHANVLSLLKPKVYKTDSKGKLTPLTVKNMDFNFINEVDTRVDFLRKLGVSLYSQGAGIIVGESTKGKVNLYTINVANVKINTSSSKLIESFVYTAGDGNELEYKPKDVIYINDSIDPSNLTYSLSRLKSLNDVIQIQAGIVTKVKDSIQGGAKDSFIISAKDPMSKDTQSAIKAGFDAFMKSTASSTLLINSDLNFKTVGNSMTGAEMLNFFTKVNQMMIEHYNIPPALIGDYATAGANKNEELLYSLRVWFTTMVKPVITNIELNFTRYLVDTLGIKNAVFVLDTSDVDILEDPIDSKVDRAIKLHKAGLMSFNEARKVCELEELKDDSANLHFLPQYLTGSAPISVENFTAEVERFLQGSTSSTDTTATGSSGGEDNTNIITESRGGTQGNI